jgi:hypothetical protein
MGVSLRIIHLYTFNVMSIMHVLYLYSYKVYGRILYNVHDLVD